MDYKKLAEEKLRQAACFGDLVILSDLISKGVDVNSKNDVNGWTALHWAACRGNVEAVGILLKNGANKDALTHNNETACDLSSSEVVQLLLGGKITPNKKAPLPIIPNYLRNPPLCLNMNYNETNLANQTVENCEKVLVLKLEVFRDPSEFVEIEIPVGELSLDKLKGILSKELECEPSAIIKIIKLPNTIIRNDKDVQRLTEFQEIRVVTA